MKPNRILIALILAIFFKHSRVKATISCENAPKNCECLANRMQKRIELQCPQRTNRQVVVKYQPYNPTQYKLEIRCYNSSFDVSSLDLKMEYVRNMNVFTCRPNSTMFFNLVKIAFNLTSLKFFDLHLEDDDVDVLLGLSRNLKLESVTLNRNQLRHFPDVITGWSQLDLANNLIGNLPNMLNSSSLETLDLKNNSIGYVKDSLFEASPKLVYVDLSQNNIAYLPPQLLDPIRNLAMFSLSSNNISKIPDGFFRSNNNLKEVALSNLQLVTIGTDLFSNCTELEKLRLANNSLRSLPGHMFVNMPSLTYLELSMNLFSNFSQDTFKGLVNLKHLYLLDNRLTTWSKDYNRDFQNLFRLQLNKNSLGVIRDDTFTGLDKLKYLDLSHNEISEIGITAFVHLKNLKELNLSYNKLSVGAIDPWFNRIPHMNVPNSNLHATSSNRASSEGLRQINMLGNPINCDCQSYDFLRYFQHVRFKSQKDYKGECADPTRWKGTKLKDVDLDRFTCENVKFYDCPKGCDCRIHPAAHILEIDCSDTKMVRPPVLPPLDENLFDFNITLKEIWVDLSNNAISEFAVQDGTYWNVTVLNLSSNHLKRIDGIPPSVAVLNLENNMLTRIDNKLIESFNKSSTLKRVSLEGNPWVCDCEMVPFATMLRTHSLTMIPNNNLTCDNGTLLIELNETIHCSIDETIVVLIVVLSIFVFLSIILVVLYVHFQYHLKIWLYNHKLLLSFINEKDIDEDKTFDAFVSYSHKDEDFIVKHLQPELENCQQKYKLCLHDRDWIVGESIPKQIYDSVENSRRTIIVLSRNFLSSDWSNMEFKAAYSKTLLDERNRLIVILYEDIDASEINNEELKIYLSTKTYIKWGDAWFWKDLKKAMPKRHKLNRRKSPRKPTTDEENCINT